ATAADIEQVETLWRQSAVSKRVDAVPDRRDIADFVGRRLIEVGESDGRTIAARSLHYFDKPVGYQMNIQIFTADADAERSLLQDSIGVARAHPEVKLVHYWRGRGEPVDIGDLGFSRGPAFVRMDRPNMDKLDAAVLPKG